MKKIIETAKVLKSTDSTFTIGDKKVSIANTKISKQTKDFINNYLLPLEKFIKENKDDPKRQKQINKYEKQLSEWNEWTDNIIELIHVQGYMITALLDSKEEIDRLRVFNGGKVLKTLISFQQEALNKLYKRINTILEFKK